MLSVYAFGACHDIPLTIKNSGSKPVECQIKWGVAPRSCECNNYGIH
jgi:hypothetical protein